MQIYCFDIDGSPDWPSGTSVTAHDRRTAASVVLFRDLGPGTLPTQTQPGNISPSSLNPGYAQAMLERRRQALAIMGTLSQIPPPNPSKGTQSTRPATELFTFGGFIGLAAPDAATAAPVLEKLRAKGLFQVAQPPAPPPPPPDTICSRCRLARPVNATGLCAVCASTPIIITDPKDPVRPRIWLGILLFIALVALAIYFAWPTPAPQPVVAPVRAPIIQFSADHQRVTRGSHVQLSWKTSGLSSLSISPIVGAVPASGKRSVRIDQDTTFSLQGTPGTGTSYVHPVTVTISVIDPDPDPIQKPSPYSGSTKTDTSPVPSPQPSPQPSTPPAPVPAPEPQPQKQPDTSYEYRPIVISALNTWAAAYRSNDARRQAALYAPQVERFFLQLNVTDAAVLTYMTNFYAQGRLFTSFSFSNPTITFIDNDTAHVRLTKSYILQLANGEVRNVTCPSELHLIRTYGSVWKINFERDFKN